MSDAEEEGLPAPKRAKGAAKVGAEPEEEPKSKQRVYLAYTSTWIDSELDPERVTTVVGIFAKEIVAYRVAMHAAAEEILDDPDRYHDVHVKRTIWSHGRTNKCDACKDLSTCDPTCKAKNCETCPACEFVWCTKNMLEYKKIKKLNKHYEAWILAKNRAYGEATYSEHSKAPEVIVEEREVQ